MAKSTKKRSRVFSPKLVVRITEEEYATAKRSHSGGCLIANAIKRDYPELSNVTVDTATIRATDRARGLRFTYLAPPLAQHILLAWDQGWPSPADECVVQRAVKIDRLTRAKTGPGSPAGVRARRQERIVELEQKEANGESLSRHEKASLTRMRNPSPTPDRPTSEGPPEVHMRGRNPVVVGGRPILQGEAHPNLLRGRNRIFGAKLADPGLAFKEAVEAALAERAAAEGSK
jgi:hypothetical protein